MAKSSETLLGLKFQEMKGLSNSLPLKSVTLAEIPVMQPIAVYSTFVTPRLKYVLGWIFIERLGCGYQLYTNESQAAQHGFYIGYGGVNAPVSIPVSGFLSSTIIAEIEFESGEWLTIPTIFHHPDNIHTLPFDLFAAVFFLLSRYEEYMPFEPDKHGRFPAEHSVLFRKGILQRPIVDEWLYTFLGTIVSRTLLIFKPSKFSYLPTYDIDIAYSHIHKGFKRMVGAYIRALLKGDMAQVSERTQVLKKKKQDPWDSFGFIKDMHQEYDYKPLYFILCALKTTDFDKNIHPNRPAMMRVIKNLNKEGELGIHPSYYATKYEVMAKELNKLKAISGHDITRSRQHYIKLHLPATYHMLLDNNITEDYSMGYGAHLGFRAGTGASFLWYDLEKEKPTQLRVYPFCFMDTTAHFELKLSVDEAFNRLNAMKKLLVKCNSNLITIFHNFSLGTDAEWVGWPEAYKAFLNENRDAHAPV